MVFFMSVFSVNVFTSQCYDFTLSNLLQWYTRLRILDGVHVQGSQLQSQNMGDRAGVDITSDESDSTSPRPTSVGLATKHTRIS